MTLYGDYGLNCDLDPNIKFLFIEIKISQNISFIEMIEIFILISNYINQIDLLLNVLSNFGYIFYYFFISLNFCYEKFFSSGELKSFFIM